MLYTSKILKHSENNNLKVHEHKYNLNVYAFSELYSKTKTDILPEE